MTRSANGIPRWLKITGAIVAIIVGLAGLGVIVLPWESTAEAKVETHNEDPLAHERMRVEWEKKHTEELRRIFEKLDALTER
jgi:hypothetical protein